MPITNKSVTITKSSVYRYAREENVFSVYNPIVSSRLPSLIARHFNSDINNDHPFYTEHMRYLGEHTHPTCMITYRLLYTDICESQI